MIPMKNQGVGKFIPLVVNIPNEALYSVIGTSLSFRSYRDNERSRPTTPPASTAKSVRATTPSEKKPTINVTVNPKSLVNPAAVAKSGVSKPSKKIDMGAALTYGTHSDLGINSPTHRNTHAESDLFDTGDAKSTVVAVPQQADLLDDIFKTCATNDQPAANEDDFFNPREEENQEFGDFASAFGNNSTAPAPAASVTASLPRPPSIDGDEFADFSSAFVAAPPTSVPAAPATNITANNSNDLLFGSTTVSQPLFSPSGPPSNNIAPVADLLSDLDGLSLNAAVPSGKQFILDK